MPTCWHCKTETTREHYARVVDGKGPLYGPWEGWRTAGRFLVSPDGDRLTPQRLRGLMFAERHRLRKEKPAPAPARLSHLIPAREQFDGRA
jgi:hypothetical protein